MCSIKSQISIGRFPVLFLFALQLCPKATEKTSQALREGQKNIRKKMFGTKYGIFTGTAASEDTDELSDVIMPAEPENCGKRLLPPVSHPKYEYVTHFTTRIKHMLTSYIFLFLLQEDYYQYSMLVLEALYNSDRSLTVPPATAPAPPQPVSQQSPALPPPQAMQSNAMYGTSNSAYVGASSAAMAMALDQFPGARMQMPVHPVPQQIQHPIQQQHFDPRIQFSMGADLSHPSFRLTDLSMNPAFSIRELLESARNSGYQAVINGARGTMESRLSIGTGYDSSISATTQSN